MSNHALVVPLALLATGALLLTGCAASAAPAESPAVEVDQSETGLAELLPDQYRHAGVLVAGVRPAAPYVLVGSGEEYTGLAIDLYEEIGALLDVEIDYLEITADAAVPSLQAQRIDMTTPMGDFPERQTSVDFADFAKSEISALSLVERGLGVQSSQDLCGLTVAIEIGVAAEEAIAVASDACVEQGAAPIAANSYPDKNAGVLAVQSGRVDALVAPFASNQEVAQAQPEMFVSEPMSDALTLPGGGAVYGIATGKDSGLAAAIAAALQELEANGTYAALFAEYGIEAAALPAAELVVNGVTETPGA